MPDSSPSRRLRNTQYAIRNTKHAIRIAALLLLLLLAPTAAAQSPQHLAGVAPAPVSGADGVEFVSQAVDAVLSQNADGSYAVSNEAAIRLYNTNRSAASVTFGFPG